MRNLKTIEKKVRAILEKNEDPRYKDGHIIFCDVCIRKILDEQREKKQRKEQPNE